jgi:energy-coupling factor transporter ATP-binding protein EcfA2
MSSPANSSRRLHVLGLEINNVLRLRAVKLDLTGKSVVVVSGKNGSGKSSVLRSVRMALEGSKSEPAEAVRRGAESGDVKIILGRNGEPSLKVRRIMKNGAESKLIVTDADDVRRSSPQEILDKLYSSVGFDPLRFMRPVGAKSAVTVRAKQVEMLLEVCPISVDLAALAAEEKAAFQRRQDVNRDEKLARTTAEAIVVLDDEEDADLDAWVIEAAQAVAKVDTQRTKIQTARNRIVSIDADVDRLKRELARLLEERKKSEADAALEMPTRDAATKELESLRTRQAEKNARAQDRTRKAETLKRADELKAMSTRLSARLEEIKRTRDDAITAAKFPVKGLGLSPDGVTMTNANGDVLLLDQFSFAEQLAVSVRVGMSANPGIGVAIIEDGKRARHGHVASARADRREGRLPALHRARLEGPRLYRDDRRRRVRGRRQRAERGRVVRSRRGEATPDQPGVGRDGHACYAVEEQDFLGAFAVLRDHGPHDRHKTITNDATHVVAELLAADVVKADGRIFYFDSEGSPAELLVHDGAFDDYGPWDGVSP